ncbi:N-acetylglucosamine-6-phosphate deacetylase [Inquilinus sp. CAU 1745]|uniref:N-acetylglucosamine-6-phosphate deacetylase n=1 Tax=Inquilinus sp. CAU 1745 TaxID=3140369 RepID=UPI00325AF1CE
MSDDLQALIGGRVFDGDRIVKGQAVLIADGRIEALVPEPDIPRDAQRVALEGGLLTPGFIDVQVNGGGGVMLNDSPTIDGVRTIAEAHRRFGTTGMLPTLITDAPDKMPAAIDAVRRAMAEAVPGILGIHLEGPFLNVARKGVHDPRLIRPIAEEDMAVVMSLETGKTLVTLAPEQAPAGTVRRLAEAGVLVCAGHTVGPYDAIRAAIAEGLRGFTHLFNAMAPFDSREPGVVGAALDDPGTWCGIIVDGHHVHPASLRVALAAKPRGRMMLVTDAMATVGAADPSFVLKGEKITEIDGRCATEDGTLAGSALDMASAVRNTIAWLGQTVEEALRMASLYPAAFLGLDDRLGRIAPGYRADLVLLDDDLAVRRTWIGGEPD